MDQKGASYLLDGSFVGTSGRYWLALRVDMTMGAISGDVQSTGPEEGAAFASFRSVDITPADVGGPIDIELTDAADNVAAGRIWLQPSSAGQGDVVHLRLESDEEVGGIPADSRIAIAARHVSPAMRELSVRIAVEEGVQQDRVALGLEPFTDRLVAWWERAGFAVTAAPDRPGTKPLPHPDGGWAESDIFTRLHDVMTARSGGRFDRPDWDLCLLVLSTTDRAGLEGLMFDVDGSQPRQGAAIFLDAIRAGKSDEALAEQMVLKTAVHELGHALNLRHRFDPAVRRSRSRSPMTYDWLYPDGPTTYWKEYGHGSFDPDELAFLRHAPRSQVIPGGAPFGSAVYWKAGPDIATDRSEPWCSLNLWLTPPPAGTSFLHGQPIFLEVSLLNTGRVPVWVPQHVLDLKAGRLDIMINRVEHGARPGSAMMRPFTPMTQRCFSVAGAAGFTLSNGDSLHTNANLTWGSSGSDFADPGVYELIPSLSFPPSSDEDPDGLDHLVVGPTLQIRVEEPEGQLQKRDAETLLGRADVGISLALGGATCFPVAAEDLTWMRERRARRAAGGPPDPIAVALARTAGIFEGRNGNLQAAVELLSQATTPEASRHFDPHTAEHTRRLAATYSAQLSPGPNPADPAVVVLDLWTAPKSGGAASGGRGAGFLTRRGAPSGAAAGADQGGWGVLAPASQLPPEAMDDSHLVAAVVTVGTGSGLTQRIAAHRIDLVSQSGGSGEPVLALVELSHPVPGRLDGPVTTGEDPPVRRGSDVASFFGGPDGHQVARRTGQELDAWSEAADEALATAQRPRLLGPAPARVHRYPRLGLDDVAGWACTLLRVGCQTPPPPRDVDTPYWFRTKRTTPRSSKDDPPPPQQGYSQAGA